MVEDNQSVRKSDETGVEDYVFSSIPWCRKILDDPDFVLEATMSRIPPRDNTSLNALVASTLRTSNTIAGWCSLVRRPASSTSGLKDEVRTLLALRSGLDSYIGVCHGGIVATLLDEVMSILIAVCRMDQGLDFSNVTADLRVTFVKPVPTPAVVLLTAKIRDIKKERKYYVNAEIVDEKGTVLARGEGLFIHVPPDTTKL